MTKIEINRPFIWKKVAHCTKFKRILGNWSAITGLEDWNEDVLTFIRFASSYISLQLMWGNVFQLLLQTQWWWWLQQLWAIGLGGGVAGGSGKRCLTDVRATCKQQTSGASMETWIFWSSKLCVLLAVPPNKKYWNDYGNYINVSVYWSHSHYCDLFFVVMTDFLKICFTTLLCTMRNSDKHCNIFWSTFSFWVADSKSLSWFCDSPSHSNRKCLQKVTTGVSLFSLCSCWENWTVKSWVMVWAVSWAASQKML